MISFLSAAQSITDPSVYGRGIRLFLEGRVGRFTELDLDYWREYEVIDKTTYTVRIPLIHLACDKSKWEKSSDILKNFTTCECEYFQEMGVCKHIVAVCASLENEFNPRKPENLKKDEEIKTDIDNVLDRVFEAQKGKQSRVWMQKLETFFHHSNGEIPTWVKEMARETAVNPENHQELIQYIHSLSKEAVQDYLREKRLIRFIAYTLQFGYKTWWEIWEPHIESLEETHKLDVIFEMWNLYSAGLMREYNEQFINWLSSISEKDKSKLIQMLKNKYPNIQEKYLKFVFASKAHDWLVSQLPYLDAETLIKAAPIIPEHDEEIQEKILQQIKLWADFFTPGHNDQIIDTFQQWRAHLGRSSYYEQAVQYFKQLHPKKRKLLVSIDQ